MYGIFKNIYPQKFPNVGKYTIHGADGIYIIIYIVIVIYYILIKNMEIYIYIVVYQLSCPVGTLLWCRLAPWAEFVEVETASFDAKEDGADGGEGSKRNFSGSRKNFSGSKKN